MSAWYWRVIGLKAVFILACYTSYLYAEDIQQLPFCNPDPSTETTNDLMIVSTLDGRITAFNTNTGNIAWDLQTVPLLTSTLHRVELTAGGKWVRLVPSLRGGLYSLSGDTIEPLPFDAEQLLFSSYKYSDDLVIAGAKDTQWMGIDVHTGTVIYQCSSNGCNSEEQTAGLGRDVLVVRRNSNIVRALEPRTGVEKWNFSVAENQLAISNRRECESFNPTTKIEYNIGVAVPEGIVAIRDETTHILLWQHKLEAPLAGVWRLSSGSLETIDILWAATKSLSTETFVQTSPPSLYVGLHNKQLYVQEGRLIPKKADTAVARKRTAPWKLKFSRPLITGPSTAVQHVKEGDRNALSLIALYDDGQIGNHGYFLYVEDTCDQAIQVTEEDIDKPEILSPIEEEDNNHPVHMHVHVYSLWYWWKEVVLIAVSSALLMNLMIWPRFFAPRIRPSTPLPINQDIIVVERHYERPPSHTMLDYSGRYENDFEPLRCLGRGGFGVVFEAKNKIDHRSYAVKRITLPRKEAKRERVLREVRALAKMEHENIVRYFNAWVEQPPPNWQEQRDAVWMRDLEGVTVASNEPDTTNKETHDMHHSSATTKSLTKPDNVMLNLQKNPWEKSIDACFDAIEYQEHLSEPRRNRSLSCNDSFSIEFGNVTKDMEAKDTSEFTNITLPNNFNMSKNLGAGDNEDSFIVFANSQDYNHNSKASEARNDGYNKQLERIKEYDGLSRSESEPNKVKKKKGHRRHWSLDLCVRSTTESAVTHTNTSKMYLYIQMQLCLRDSLHDWLRIHRTYSDRGEKAMSFFNQIVSAVEYVHLAGLIHRDLKPSNIFFSPDGRIKVGDFGLVTSISEDSRDSDDTPLDAFNAQSRHTYRVGTHLYMSPEQLRGSPYNYKVDIYSLGIILFELLQPFNTESERIKCLLSVREGAYPRSFQENYANEMQVLKLMLSGDPASRPTATGVRARAPLYQSTEDKWHFTLPHYVN